VNETLDRVKLLVTAGVFLISRHGYRELAADGILPDQIVSGIDSAVVVEDYPGAVRGPSVLVLQRDANGEPIHVLWGLPGSLMTPAVLVTAYRPDPRLWSADLTRRTK
jgi:hypothetical protein